MKEYKRYERIGTLPHRSYFIPFAADDKVTTVHGIVDRTSSSRFFSLDGTWLLNQHPDPETALANLAEELTTTIPVPSCLQLHGYDQIQYRNNRYPIPANPPHVPYENPTWHYRRDFDLDKKDGERYYLNFEGVDSAFYLYVNGEFKGYSQISHATSEFDITELVNNGKNTLDVIVLKWCASTYLEDQDKFRFSGIFRSVYILKRPEAHITDFQFTPSHDGKDGVLKFENKADIDLSLTFEGNTVTVGAGKTVELAVKNVKLWTAETPNLYPLTISANGEVIYEKVGFRTVCVEGKVFKINGEHVKLKGVNRHEFNCETGATVSLDNMVEDLKIMKYLNVNAVRTSHYPDVPEFYQLCDEFGIYVMDEADLEIHGALYCCGVPNSGSGDMWVAYADNMLFEPGITDRETALVERDKNRSSVIIWSLGNESCFGEAFINGTKYIRNRDASRPIHYEGLQHSKKYYYTDMVDMVSMMYPDVETIKNKVINNPLETRPFVLCEYTHAMGNSCGDIAEYWDLIYSNDQLMGAFVWEWADHGIKTEKGFLYGGDHGEFEHDGNFCCDGLLTPDRKIKSAALEMRAVYGGKTKSEITDVAIPAVKKSGKKIEIKVDEHTGLLTSLTADGEEIIKAPMHFNTTRYTDNDRHLIGPWKTRYKLHIAKPYVLESEKTDNSMSFRGVIVAPALLPMIEYDIKYTVVDSALEIELAYRLADYVTNVARFGLEFGTDAAKRDFSYVGFGPHESYVDKNVCCEYGYYESNADDNYFYDYVRPQESGSHYATKYLAINDNFTVTADRAFSFSVNPYTTAQLRETKHNFELPKNDFVNVCLDLGMRGIGSYSCGPELGKRYEIPRGYCNKFTITF